MTSKKHPRWCSCCGTFKPGSLLRLVSLKRLPANGKRLLARSGWCFWKQKPRVRIFSSPPPKISRRCFDLEDQLKALTTPPQRSRRLRLADVRESWTTPGRHRARTISVVSSINGVLPPILPPAPSAVRTAPLRLEEAASVDAPVARIAPSQPIDPLVAGRLAPGARLTLRPNVAQIQITTARTSKLRTPVLRPSRESRSIC